MCVFTESKQTMEKINQVSNEVGTLNQFMDEIKSNSEKFKLENGVGDTTINIDRNDDSNVYDDPLIKVYYPCYLK